MAVDPDAVLGGRVALVTGASTGLGAHFASVLSAAGADVVVTARRSSQLESYAPVVGATALAGDITSADHRQQLASLIREQFGRLDILVNNAGTADDGPLEEQTLAELTKVIDVNLVAVLDLCRVLAPPLFASGHASVINISSIFGIVGSRGPMAGYNATKGALINTTRHLAAQWGRHHVRVNALAPGYFPTAMTGELQDPELRSSIEQRTALARVPEIHELDGPLLFLASDASSYVTGHTLVVDGGWTAT
jgi:NAD(P)-dependent dehydrogenase (short-subunit alcohol dehydrogenase family)